MFIYVALLKSVDGRQIKYILPSVGLRKSPHCHLLEHSTASLQETPREHAYGLQLTFWMIPLSGLSRHSANSLLNGANHLLILEDKTNELVHQRGLNVSRLGETLKLQVAPE